MSIRKVELKDHYENIKVIVPGKTLGEISKILNGDNEKDVRIYFSKNHILFEFDDTVVVSRLIEGEYFRIDQMLSSDYETKVTVNKKETQAVFDGDIDEFIEAGIRWRHEQRRAAAEEQEA